MGLNGKLVSQTNIKSDGYAYYELLRCKPCDISNICPDMIHSVDLLGGQWGANGSVIFWTWTQGGEKLVSKEIIEGVDEAKKSITYKVIEGSLLDHYNTFKFVLNVDCNGEDNVVTWTLEYMKKSECVPEPHAIMDVLVTMTKQIDQCNNMLVPN